MLLQQLIYVGIPVPGVPCLPIAGVALFHEGFAKPTASLFKSDRYLLFIVLLIMIALVGISMRGCQTAALLLIKI